jgi:hypothetical protein
MRYLPTLLIATALTGTLATAAFAADNLPEGALTKPVVAKNVPRNPDGHADLTGIWTNVSITPMTRPANFGTRKELTKDEAAKLEGAAVQHFVDGAKPTDPNSGSDGGNKKCNDAGGLDCGYNTGWKDSGTTVVRVNGVPRTSFVTYPANGQLPPRTAGAPSAARFVSNEGEEGGGAPAARPAAAAGGRGGAGAPAAAGGRGGGGGAPRMNVNDNPENHSPGERCLTSFGNSAGPVMAPLMYNNNYSFVQTKDAIAIEVEMVHDVRTIRLNTQHRTDGVRPWFGDTIGHWEGDTLVTETTNFPALQYQSFQRGADANLKVTEKFTRVSKDGILYQFIVEDPTVWAQPWAGEYTFVPTKGLIYEYACHEGNYALEGMLAGARGEEEEAAKKAKATASR